MNKISIFDRLNFLFNPNKIRNSLIEDYNREFLSGNNVTITSEDTAQNISAVWACLRVIAEAFASVPIFEYKKDKKSGDREATDDLGIYDMLHNKPNSSMSPFSFYESLSYNVNLGGNAVCLKQKNYLGGVVSLIPIDHGRVRIEFDKDRNELTYKIDGKNTYTRNDILHIPGPSVDGMIGMSVIEAASSAIKLSLQYQNFGLNFFKNGIAPSGVFEHPAHLSDEDFDRFKARLKKQYTQSNQGTPLILEDGLKFNNLTMKLVDAEFLSSRKFQLEEICRYCRVPLHLVQNLDRATFCLTADTDILTVTGPKKIVDVEVGETVLSFDGSNIVKSKVKNVAFSGVDKIYEISTTNRKIRCNGNHKILIRKKYSVKQSNKFSPKVEWKNEYVKASDLSEGDTIVTLNHLSDCNNNTIAPNGRILTPGFMSFCGLLLGDGNVFNGSVSIARDNNARHMDEYRSIIRKEFVCYDGGNGKETIKNKKKTRQVKLQEGDRQTRFSSVLAASELKELGFSGDSHTKRIPGWIFNLSEDLRLAFIRGYVDSDGHVDKKGRISFTSVNNTMLSQLWHLCITVGVPVTNIRHGKQLVTLPNKTKYKSEFYTFTCSDPGQNIRIGSYDPQAQKRFFDGKPFQKKDRNYPRYGGKNFNINDCGLSRITSIKITEPEPVYDLQIDKTESFVANGVVVHNSNIEHMSLEFVMYTMLPWFKRFEDAINCQLLTDIDRKAGYHYEFKISSLVRGDLKSRYEAYNIGRNAGFLSVNDIRKLENLPSIPNGDIYLQPVNMVEAGKEPEPVEESKVQVEQEDSVKKELDTIFEEKNNGK